MDRLEQSWQAGEQRKETLSQDLLRLKAQSDSLAGLINPLKAKSDLTFFERRKLDALLANAQQLAGERERLTAAWKEIKQRQTNLTMRLDSLYTAILDSVSLALQSKGAIQVNDKNRMLAQLAQWQEKRRRLQNNLLMESSAAMQNLSIDSDDLPEDIQRKADFLRDRSDKLQLQIRQITSRTDQVQKEITLRRRMADLVSDVRLFDSQDETARNPSTASSTLDGTRGKDLQTAESDKGNVGFAPQHPTDALLYFDFRTLPVYSLDEFLSLLEAEKHKLKGQADSLAGLAASFEEQAKRLRATLKNQLK